MADEVNDFRNFSPPPPSTDNSPRTCDEPTIQFTYLVTTARSWILQNQFAFLSFGKMHRFFTLHLMRKEVVKFK